MKEIVSKHRKSEIKTGVHLVTISDLFYARSAEKEVLKFDGFPAIIVQYKNKDGIHDQFYICDKGRRQYYFDKAIKDAGVNQEIGKPPKKDDIVGKKIYIAIQEVHHVNDENPILENGEPIIEYSIFRTMPDSEGIIYKLKGDPAINNGIASDDFVTYRNLNNVFVQEEEEFTPPNFDIE